MSELKVYRFLGQDEVWPDANLGSDYYLKSEADKVIAELKAQKAQVEDDCAYWKTMSRKNADDNEVMAKQRADAFKRERRQKYKRCLAMARWCELKRIDAADYRIPREKWEFYDKWHRRWLELAEKFEEAK